MPSLIRTRRQSAVCALAILLSLVIEKLPAQQPPTPPRNTIKDRGALKVASLKFDNFLGVVSSSIEVKSGDELGMKFSIDGYSREEHKDEAGRPEYNVNLTYGIDVRDPEGKPLQPADAGRIQTILSLQDDAWKPSVEWSVRVPETAPTGRYSVAIKVHDEIGQQTIEEMAFFRVRGQSLKTSGEFEIVGVEFAPSDKGPWRPIWYFESRAPIYVRYKIAGYAVGPDRQIQVEQDWAVLDTNGKAVINQPSAKIEESRGFYSPRFIQSYFSITLRDASPGDYKVKIDARDRVGNKSATAEARFVLRP